MKAQTNRERAGSMDKEPGIAEAWRQLDGWLAAAELRLMQSYMTDNGDGTFSIRKPQRYVMDRREQ